MASMAKYKRPLPAENRRGGDIRTPFRAPTHLHISNIIRLWGGGGFSFFWIVPLLIIGIFRGETGYAASLQGPPPVAHSSVAAATFDDCVQRALRQSPYLTKSSLELEVRRLDEWDQRVGFLPSVSVRFRYYVAKPGSASLYNPAEYTVEVYSDNYNPLAAYFNLQAQKIVTQIAIQAHLKVIGEVLQALGQGFLELETMQRLAEIQGELVAQAQKKVNYFEQHLKLGVIAPLELQVATQELELAKAEAERLAASQTKTVQALKGALGLKPEDSLSLDLKEVRRQVLGTFDPQLAKLEEARNKSADLKIKTLTRELRSWHVTLAKIKFLPDIYLGFQTPDPLSLANVEGLFFAVGLTWNVPFLDGFRKVRNVSRQKVLLKQADAEVHTKEIDFEEKWLAAQNRLKSTQAALKIAQSQEELARLKERQSDIRYQAGEDSYEMLVAGRQGYLNAKINTQAKTLEYDLAVLNLCHLAGDLVNRYITESAFRR